MWKTITRGFRETFERGLSFGRNNNNRVHNETQRAKYCHYYTRPACFLTSYRRRHSCQEGPRGNEGTREDQRAFGAYDAFDSWLGAVSCSSALALGWVLSQPCNWKRWFRDYCPPTLTDCCRPNKYKNLVGVLTKVAVAQPPLAPVRTAQEVIENGISYGPQTGEEALNEAAENFLKVHNSIFGEVENKKAVALIEGPNKDEGRAIKLFYSASKKGYIPASYNLGQCYELGIGTKQDFHEAAKWYQKAADGGHPAATYNLAVFHAHGWGGLAPDQRKARELLKSAAALGQPDAAAALGITLDTCAPPPSPLSSIPKEEVDNNESRVPPLQDVSGDPNELFKLASSFENNPCEDTTHPYLVLQLYKMASDLGHKEAKSKYQILQSYDTVGLLTEYLCRGSKPTRECSNLKFTSLF